MLSNSMWIAGVAGFPKSPIMTYNSLLDFYDLEPENDVWYWLYGPSTIKLGTLVEIMSLAQ